MQDAETELERGPWDGWVGGWVVVGGQADCGIATCDGEIYESTIWLPAAFWLLSASALLWAPGAWRGGSGGLRLLSLDPAASQRRMLVQRWPAAAAGVAPGC